MAIFYNPNKKKGLFYAPSGATGGAGGGGVLSIEYSATTFCDDGTDPIPGITGQTGGTFSSTTGLVFISTSTGQVDLSASTPGTYVVTYTAPNSNTATTSISIDAVPVVSAGADVAICIGNNTILTATGATTYSWSTGETTASITVEPTTNTTYTVTGVNGVCSATDSVDVTVNPLPSVSISGALTYCVGATTTLDAGSFVSYLWSNGETTQTISATAGNYTVTVTDSNGCSNTSAQVTVSELPLDDASFSYSTSDFIQSMPDPTPTITGLAGGTFSAGSGLVFVDSGTNTGSSTGEIDLSASTIASYTVTYTTSGTCPNTSTQTVNVLAALLQLDNLHSMSFDGVNDYIEAGSLNILNFERTDSFSISAWVKRAGTGIDEAIVSKMLSFGSNRGYLLSIGNTNVVKFVLRNSNTGINLLFVDSTTTITDTNWHHILITYNGSSNVSGVKIYIDGLSDTVTTSGTLSATTVSSAPFNIGAKNSDSLFANSEIDEVAVFNTNLTELEVKSIYYATETGKTADLDDLTTPPIAWYRM